jgi:Mg/Co/Ni transporter MgtE
MVFEITSKDKFKYLIKPLSIGLMLDIIIVLIIGYYYNENFIMVLKMLLGVLIGQSFLFYIPIILF